MKKLEKFYLYLFILITAIVACTTASIAYITSHYYGHNLLTLISFSIYTAALIKITGAYEKELEVRVNEKEK